jgi:hypothetical protein
MTFTEKIYDQINSLSPLSTDDFSIHWLSQSRSYYSSNKARGLEASNSALVKLEVLKCLNGFFNVIHKR